MTATALAAVLVLLAGACGAEPTEPREEPGHLAPFTPGGRIAWDHRTLRRPFQGPASYPRMIRLRDGALLLSVESRGASWVLRSENDGVSWSPPVPVAEARDGIIAAVPSLLQLHDGTVLLAYNPRPPQNNTDPARRFGIRLAASTDGGRSWEERAVVFQAGHEWGRGVWEPAMLQLATGEILLFVANEYPYGATDEQEISLLRSRDAGRSWSAPETVSFRAGHRDGMPVPLRLADGSGIVVAIEDNGLVAGTFRPAVIRLPASGAQDGVVRGDSPLRWPALAPEERVPASAYAGAPYLAQFPDGETVLSYQGNQGREGDWTRSTMVVALGDAGARSFSRRSRPFLVPEGRSALWGSVFVSDSNRVTALTTTTAYTGTTRELYLVDGRRIAEPRAPIGAVRVDGDGSDAVWTAATEGQVGAYGPKSVRFRTAWDQERFYARLEVEDPTEVVSSGISEADDAVVLYLAPRRLRRDAPVAGAFRVRLEADGGVRVEEGREGRWVARPATGVLTAVSAARTGAAKARTIEIGIPWALIGGRPVVGEGWGLNVESVDSDGRGSVLRESVGGNEADRPGSWLRVELRG